MDSSGVLQSANRRQRRCGIWLRARAGQSSLSPRGIFSNAVIGEQDNARLLSNLIAGREAAGTVIFDDAHQGAVTYYDAKAFFKDPRLHRTLRGRCCYGSYSCSAFSVCAAGRSTGIRSMYGVRRRQRRVLCRTLTSATRARGCLRIFFNSIRCRLGLVQDGTPNGNGCPHRRSGSRDLEELRRLHERAQAGRSVDLVRLQNLLFGCTGISYEHGVEELERHLQEALGRSVIGLQP